MADRDDNRRRGQWLFWLCLTCGAMLLYLLGFGPAWYAAAWWARRQGRMMVDFPAWVDALMLFYLPVSSLAEYVPILARYRDWWFDLGWGT